MIIARRWLARIGLACAAATLVFFHTNLCAWVSVVTAAVSVGLLAVLLWEIASGAGAIVHTQFERGTELFREVEYIPSLTTARVCASVAVGLVGQVIGFAGMYAAAARTGPDVFSGWTDDRVGSLYFSAVTFATVGFGDIVPRSSLARTAVLTEIAFAFTSIAGVVSSLVSWIMAQAQRDNERRVRERVDAVQEFEDALKKAKVGLYAAPADSERLHELLRRAFEE